MLRAVGGVILGYVAMFIVVFGTFTAAYLAMGADRSFRPGTYEISVLWAVVSIVLGLLAAVVGGMVCAAVAGPKAKGATTALCVLVLVLGLGMAVWVMMAPEPPAADLVRGPGVTNMEAMEKARTPVWFALVTPVLSAAGVWVGSGWVQGRRGGGRG